MITSCVVLGEAVLGCYHLSRSTIPVNTLISIPVLLAVFAVCLVINLLSAGIPAYRASRMKIINSLNQNDN